MAHCNSSVKKKVKRCMPMSVHISFTRIHCKRYAGRQASIEWDL